MEAAEEEIREEIATMYVLRSTYVGKLEAIVQSAIDEYTAGEHTSERRTQVVYGKLEELTALEKECDQKVAAVVARLQMCIRDRQCAAGTYGLPAEKTPCCSGM